MPRRILNYVLDNSLLLLIGAVAGLLWANVSSITYTDFRDARLFAASWMPLRHEASQQGIGVNYLVNDVLMAFFFALAGKEVWEAMLPGGALRSLRRAATPVVCAVGGMAGPAIIYLLGAMLLGQFSLIARGWAIPCATDVAFSYMIALVVFGRNHPATSFLLLLAIADDALGLLILATFYPQKPVQPLWLILVLGAVPIGLALRRRRVGSFWWYLLLPGVISWSGFALSGLHPALGLLPVIPTLPHAHTGQEHAHGRVSSRNDALNQLESWWKNPVQVILGVFGLLNAGVPFTALGATTFLILLGLLVGKPVGIFLTGLLATRAFGLWLPEGISWRTLFVIGCAAGIGFTVALFITTVAFGPGPIQDASKMGALASGVAALVAIAAGRLLRIEKTPSQTQAG